MQPATVLPREQEMSEHVLGRVLQELGRLGELRGEHPSDLVQLLRGALMVGLGEHGLHDRLDISWGVPSRLPLVERPEGIR